MFINNNNNIILNYIVKLISYHKVFLGKQGSRCYKFFKLFGKRNESSNKRSPRRNCMFEAGRF